MTFLYLILMTYALCYLAADARIFGADTTAWNDVYGDYPASEDDERWVWSLGIIPLRQQVLSINAVREHLSCYFCMGVWAGPVAHLILWSFYRLRVDPTSYVLQHSNTTTGWLLGLLCAFLLGSVGSYIINAVLHRLEETDG